MIKENIYTNGQYAIDYAFGKYHIMYYPVGPARPHMPVKYRLSGRNDFGNAVTNVDFRAMRDSRCSEYPGPSLADLEYQKMYSLGLVP
jgi:hypothetical protein